MLASRHTHTHTEGEREGKLISAKNNSLIRKLGLRLGVTDSELLPGEGFDGDAAADGGEEFPEAVDSH